eukprot:13822113-Alexandrium_andersonii.AAC.1
MGDHDKPRKEGAGDSRNQHPGLERACQDPSRLNGDWGLSWPCNRAGVGDPKLATRRGSGRRRATQDRVALALERGRAGPPGLLDTND